MMNKQDVYPNIRFGTFELDIIGNEESLKDYSVICVMTKTVEEETVRLYAENLLKRGCRDFGFCGVDRALWHRVFDSADININEEKEWGTTWDSSGDTIADIADDLCVCKENVYILCTDYDTVRKCYNAIADAGYGLHVRYMGM